MDAHENEYFAAVAALPDQTISRRIDGYAIGDQISFRLRSWGESGWQTGRIADFNEARGTILVETEDDIVEVDARPCPAGEVLPF